MQHASTTAAGDSRAKRRRLGLAFVLLHGLGGGAGAQTAPPIDLESPPNLDRPGLFRAGSFYLTPYLRVGTLGVDTNVFYTATERRTDFTASGGPGFEIVRPFGRESRFVVDGGLDYLYFAKTESQRRLNGYGTALLDVWGVKTHLAIEERYLKTFSRPSYEVNDRVEQETEGTRALFRRDLGDRLRLVLFGSRKRTVTDNQYYLGTNLGDTLTENRYLAGGELQLGLSVKTRLVAGGENSWHRFERLPDRDAQSSVAYGGFRTDQAALVSGRALGGMRWFRLDKGAIRNVVYADVNAVWNISFKTKLGGIFTRNIDYSAFATSGPTPTNRNELGEVFFEKVLVRNVYLRLFARQHRLVSDGDVALVIPGEGIVLSERNDRVREAGAEIGYQFRSRIRAGVTAMYTDRDSSIQSFGIQGLLAGFTLQYDPPQPTSR